MHIVHLMASPFVGGPERQVLGLARALPSGFRTSLLSFAERGLARPLLDLAAQQGFEAVELRENFPRAGRAADEIAGHLIRLKADVLCTSGYKPDLIGWRAARRARLPVVAIAHGWTGATLKVRFNETLDGLVMRWLDAVVCVSEAMAARVRRRGVPASKIVVIRNALDTTPFDDPFPGARRNVELLFQQPPRFLVGAVGRLSPEKGFDVLIDAAKTVVQHHDDVGFVLFGDGPLRRKLEAKVKANGLEGRFVLAGFRGDLEKYLPGLDLAVSSSHTEGLPVAVLEAQAAGVAVVATAVGGTPEVVQTFQTGFLVPPGDAAAIASRILMLRADDETRSRVARQARQRVRDEFSFAVQAARYQELFARLVPGECHVDG